MSSNVVPSPCVNICALDDDDVCTGCFRTGKEITEWGLMTPDQKRAVRAACAEREQASVNFFITGQPASRSSSHSDSTK